jgi:pyruvate formate lyase activating enzyme
MNTEYFGKGNVLRFEKTSIHDGQGLRTVIYLKGCPAKCIWCSTPESQKSEPELGFIKSKCNGCGDCISVCPTAAISIDKDDRIAIDREKCNGCYKCVDKCMMDAFVEYGQTMTIDEVVREVAKDEIFYFHSNGGVTLSGGEVMMQPDFAADILKECKMLGINTAIETSLIADFGSLAKVLPWVDTVFVDIKMMNEEDHEKYVGVRNKLILENILAIDKSEYRFDLIIRVPFIQGVNDTDENMKMTASFCSHLSKLKEIEILPYHRFGVETYSNLDEEYPLGELKIPDKEYLLDKAKIMDSMSGGKKVKLLQKYIELDKSKADKG